MDERIKQAIAEHALAEYPRECCGLVVGTAAGDVYVPGRNIAAVPTEQFGLAAEDYADAEDMGEILAFVHSHPNGRAQPSMADRTVCERSGIPLWVIVSLGVQADGTIGVDDWCEFGPSGYVAPLYGREFLHGVLDCYSLVRDWYLAERGVVLPDFEREDGWWDDGRSNLYIAHYQDAGFLDVGIDVQLEPGDVLLMQIRSKNGVPNHAGVYLGDGMFGHHVHGRLSCRAVWGSMWRDSCTTVLRHIGGAK
ncbi:phage tail protein [Burkholderia cepacia]|uniref:Phage tail protein n=1 Tax=Burkholderia cepacia TaxID=292 RepID=A0AAX2RM43_BURCE|nr:C40 family peptidase [Burkholderia cepacia]TES74150.1 phage tail protein [Burkholderia cepacia]TES99896.1 phage tail protein [Burkholderia cepacia]TEU36521.1 phage tail protein [Burkholderia cepacia]TEU43157.1 phage tail protein [Burkholderia cepacia]TEU47439.1 phage tail protein [Burkholderia cepacia]